MQTETEKNISEMTEHEQLSLYRTQWLMAHNRLYDLVHKSDLKPDEVWRDYLRDFNSAEIIAHQPA